MKKNIHLITALISTSTVILTACGGGNTTSTDAKNSTTNPGTNTAATNVISGPIPIGIALAQTSNIALLGQDGINGAKIAEKYFNEKGGINGTPIKLVVQDTGGDEQGAINVIQTLINKDRVVGIVGPTLSQQAFSASPIADRAKVPIIGASNTAKGIPEIGDFVSRVSAPVNVVAPNSIKAALKKNPNIKKVAVFYAQNDAFSKSETEVFQQVVKDAKLELATVQKFQTSDTDFQAQATNAINAKVDLVIISGLTADGGNLVRQLRELGYKGIIVGGNGFNTANIFKVCGAKCDEVLVAQAYSTQEKAPINTPFRQAYKTQFNIEPPQFSAQAFTAVQVYVEALQALDKKTKVNKVPLEQLRVDLNKQLLTGKYTTPLGNISFTPIGEVVQKNFYVAQIKMNPDGNSGTFALVK